MKMQKNLDIHAPQFSRADLVKVSGLDPKIVKLWIGRRLIRPARKERVDVRSRLHFSVVTIFEAKLMRLIGENVVFGPSHGNEMAALAEAAKPKTNATISSDVARVLADDGWMWAVARSVELGKPLRVFAGIANLRGCWNLHLRLNDATFEGQFEPEVSYIVVPVGEVFATVYRDCRALSVGPLPEPRRTPRARR
jgi:hypothetical protein